MLALLKKNRCPVLEIYNHLIILYAEKGLVNICALSINQFSPGRSYLQDILFTIIGIEQEMLCGIISKCNEANTCTIRMDFKLIDNFPGKIFQHLESVSLD